MPSSRDVASLLRTYTALVGCSPDAIAAPSMMLPRTGESVLSADSPRKVDCPRLANQHDLDLPRILELGLDAARDLLRHRRHAYVIDVIGQHDHAHFAAGLNR